MSAAELLAEYRDLRAGGASPMRRREAYDAYFRAACAEGRPPDQLSLYSSDEAERFWARTVPGTDGHIYWTGGGRYFRTNAGLYRRPLRWAWKRAYGELSRFQEIAVTCGEPNCVNVKHMREVPRAERRTRFPDSAAFGAAQVLALRLGRAPTSDEWDGAGLPVGYGAMTNRFGTWHKFLIAAGLTPNLPHRRRTDEHCAEAVEALAQRIGHVPTEYDWNQNREWLRERGYPTSPDTIGVARRLQRPGNRWVVKR